MLGLASVVHTATDVWRHLAREQRQYGAHTDTRRRRAPIDALGLPGDVFDSYRRYVGRGGRVYFQVRDSGFSSFYDLPTAVRFAAHYYLLPAIEAESLGDATVVVTFFDDPNRVGVEYVTQRQAGLQPIFVSRIRSP